MSEQPLCPFCGKPLEWYAPEEIFWCGNIHCVVILESIPKIPKAEQIKRLNRRPLEDALKARIAVLEAALVEIRERSFRCLLPAEEIETEREFFAYAEINEIGMEADRVLKGEVQK